MDQLKVLVVKLGAVDGLSAWHRLGQVEGGVGVNLGAWSTACDVLAINLTCNV